MNQTDQQKLYDEIRKALEKAHRDGLLQGSKAMCRVILDRAQNDNISDHERIADIEMFCKTSLGITSDEENGDKN